MEGIVPSRREMDKSFGAKIYLMLYYTTEPKQLVQQSRVQTKAQKQEER